MSRNPADSAQLASLITRSASLQTFSTIRLLADRGRAADAYRAYAYFRWVDDWLDTGSRSLAERRAFVDRQLSVIDGCFAGSPPNALAPEEEILADLICGNPDPDGPLAAYVHNMMAVMAFDASRRGRLISQAELNVYQRSLAVAVTEAMHYFIGRQQLAPHTPDRFIAVTAAHITHMLRDTHEDLRAGYFNIPAEFVRAHGVSALDADSPAYSAWAQMRVALARQYFAAGRRYIKQVQCARCRLAAYAYISRFETVLEVIEHDGFTLRTEYSASKTLGAGLRMFGSIIASSLGVNGLAPAGKRIEPDGLTGGS
jgi:phytoene/squalene synthetase